ncbi:hypothetical protein FRB94_009125 [Tulasnella sp. JGI-2019a]|nr:hypothetical protein FRB94_009125 [Tulasnella sp. JGI-2019a]
MVFFDLASQETYRWQSAEFNPPPIRTIALLRHFVALSAPSLEGLRICRIGYEELSMNNSIDIFSGGTDRLRHIDLYNFSVPWTSGFPFQLETLKISAWPRDCPGLSTSEITDILRQCPKLRAFGLRHNGDNGGASLAEAEVAHLPALTSFKLQLGHSGAFTRIISPYASQNVQNLH